MIPIHPVESLPAERAAAGPRGLHWLARAPHRLFFFLGAVGVLGAGAWWAVVLAARAAGVAWPMAIAPGQLHSALMIHGFMPFFFWGFLFTAGPKWLKATPQDASSLAPWAVVAALAVAAMPVAATLSAGAVAIAALVQAACWLALSARFARLVVGSRASDTAHGVSILVACGLGGVSLVAFALGLWSGRPVLLRASVALGIWGFCAPVFFTVAHRMLPFFSLDGPAFAKHAHPAWLLAPMVVGLWLHGAAEIDGAAWLQLAVDVALAAVTVRIAVRWTLSKAASTQRLMKMLRVGFGWLGAAFVLYAIDDASLLAGGSGLGLAPLHALTIGCFGSLALAMVTRVTCGQSGRTVAADRATWWLFVVFQGAALLRIAAESPRSPDVAAWLSVAAIGVWVVAFGGWAARWLPVYLSPRADGRPG